MLETINSSIDSEIFLENIDMVKEEAVKEESGISLTYYSNSACPWAPKLSFLVLLDIICDLSSSKPTYSQPVIDAFNCSLKLEMHSPF